MESAPGPETVIDGRRYLYFAGTSYLGLAGHPEVVEAACAAVRRYGVHTATSRGWLGNNPLTLEVERSAAAFFGMEDAFYFASGYTGNHIVLQALADQIDAVFIDEASHYCLVEAARLLNKPVFPFPQRNAGALGNLLREKLPASQCPLVLSDGVFSVSGALAPAPEYLKVLQRQARAILHLDDAHGFGVLGENGRGVLDHFGLWGPRINARTVGDGVTLTVCGTCSKALGGFGGIIPGSRAFVQQIRAASHYFDGASAPSSADAGATAKALEIAAREPSLRRQLDQNTRQLRAGLRALGLPAADGPASHFSVELEDAARLQEISARLRVAGIIVPYVRAYSGLGPRGALRFAVCARHTPEMIGNLLAELRKIV